MGTMTAQLLIGQTHSYEGGLVNHTHSLYLTENNLPAWTIVPRPTHQQRTTDLSQTITWIPTAEHMLEDGLLMAAMYAIKEPHITNLANQYMQIQNKEEPLMLYDAINEDHLTELHKQVRQLNTGHKIIITIHNSSSIAKQIDVIREYQHLDFEVCISKYVKQRGGFGPVFMDDL